MAFIPLGRSLVAIDQQKFNNRERENASAVAIECRLFDNPSLARLDEINDIFHLCGWLDGCLNLLQCLGCI